MPLAQPATTVSSGVTMTDWIALPVVPLQVDCSTSPVPSPAMVVMVPSEVTLRMRLLPASAM